jgi:hypothetical protein
MSSRPVGLPLQHNVKARVKRAVSFARGLSFGVANDFKPASRVTVGSRNWTAAPRPLDIVWHARLSQ